MKEVTTYVGIDAHKKDLFIAMLIGQQKTPVTWQLANEPQAVRRLVRKLERDAPGPVSVFYEAGPCGYALQRQVTTSRVSCDVVAPALIPRKPGERVKTNRRDARKLVELGRAGLLTAVQPPTPEDEAVRDLARARDDARGDLQRCRHRLGKLLLRRGLHYAGRNWTRGHRQWIDSLTWAHAAERVVVDDYQLAIDRWNNAFGLGGGCGVTALPWPFFSFPSGRAPAFARTWRRNRLVRNDPVVERGVPRGRGVDSDPEFPEPTGSNQFIGSDRTGPLATRAPQPELTCGQPLISTAGEPLAYSRSTPAIRGSSAGVIRAKH